MITTLLGMQEREIQPDEDMTKSKGKDPLEGLGGPMTRARVILLNS